MLIKPVTFTFATESLGVLECLVFRRADVAKVEEQLGKNIELSTPEEYARALISLTCRRSCSITAPLLETSLADLSFSDVASLSDEELEAFSEKYLKENQHLFKKSSSKLEKRPEGEVINIGVLGDVQYPRKDNETAVMYLYRLASIEKKNEMDHLKKIAGPMEQFAKSCRNLFSVPHSSQSIFAGMNQILNDRRSLNEAFANIGKVSSAHSENHSLPPVDLAKSSSVDTLVGSPLREIGTRLDSLIEITQRSNEFTVQFSQKEMEFYQSQRASGQKSIFLGGVVLFVSICALISNCSSSSNIVNSMERLSRTIEISSQDQKKLALRASSVSNELIQQLISQQKLILQELENINRNLSSKGQAPGQSQKSTPSR